MADERITDELIDRLERTPTRLEDASTELLRYLAVGAAVPDGTRMTVTVANRQPSCVSVPTADHGLCQSPRAPGDAPLAGWAANLRRVLLLRCRMTGG